MERKNRDENEKSRRLKKQIEYRMDCLMDEIDRNEFINKEFWCEYAKLQRKLDRLS